MNSRRMGQTASQQSLVVSINYNEIQKNGFRNFFETNSQEQLRKMTVFITSHYYVCSNTCIHCIHYNAYNNNFTIVRGYLLQVHCLDLRTAPFLCVVLLWE